MQTQCSYCVTHEPPYVPPKFTDVVIGLGDYHPPRGMHISLLDEFWNKMRPCAYGAAGNYVIPKAMDTRDATEVTAILSHRKFIVRKPLGSRSRAYPIFWDVPSERAELLHQQDVSPNPGYEFLVGEPIRFERGIVSQYIEKHRAIDLFQYLDITVRLGVLAVDEVQQFALETIFFPGGCELGIYPSAWLRTTLAQLERVGREFVSEFETRIRSYDDYQVRAVGFLAERLGSFLLFKELKLRYPKGIPRDIFGYLCAVNQNGEGYSRARVS